MHLNLSIKGVPKALADMLRRRAVGNHRSLQGELMAILEAAVQSAPLNPSNDSSRAPSDGNANLTVAEPDAANRTMPDGTNADPSRSKGPLRPLRGGKTIEQIGAEHLELYPEPFRDLPLAADMIRADRDAR